jgi:hypothetical protein
MGSQPQKLEPQLAKMLIRQQKNIPPPHKTVESWFLTEIRKILVMSEMWGDEKYVFSTVIP